MSSSVRLVDCTLRDGGYYNSWDFDSSLVKDYLDAMVALGVDFVELGFRSLKNDSFKGGFAFTTDTFIESLNVPEELIGRIGVMVNGSELIGVSASSSNSHEHVTIDSILSRLFAHKKNSPVSLVRIACHADEFEACLPAANWLKSHGYLVGFNLMQIAERSFADIVNLIERVNDFSIDVLYFADSMGSLAPEDISNIIDAFRVHWQGDLGIHTHDNMGQALVNSLTAVNCGVNWIDSTVTGMGRGPGNVQTEYLSIALESARDHANSNPTKLFELIRRHFKPLQSEYGWGTNPYYYLAGKYGIHPSYIQEMLSDSRYSEEDLIAVINHLKVEGGKKFSLGTLAAARHFYSGEPRGDWNPSRVIDSRDVLVIGTGPGIEKHRAAIESYILKFRPYVIALNTQQTLKEALVDARAACHPIRLLADCHEYLKFPQPLITPASMLPNDVLDELSGKELYDFGLSVTPGKFAFHPVFCEVPSSAVVAYVLAVANAGGAKRVLLAGFDGYAPGDSRNHEMIDLFQCYLDTHDAAPIVAVTPTQYQITERSIYGSEI